MGNKRRVKLTKFDHPMDIPKFNHQTQILNSHRSPPNTDEVNKNANAVSTRATGSPHNTTWYKVINVRSINSQSAKSINNTARLIDDQLLDHKRKSNNQANYILTLAKTNTQNLTLTSKLPPLFLTTTHEFRLGQLLPLQHLPQKQATLNNSTYLLAKDTLINQIVKNQLQFSKPYSEKFKPQEVFRTLQLLTKTQSTRQLISEQTRANIQSFLRNHNTFSSSNLPSLIKNFGYLHESISSNQQHTANLKNLLSLILIDVYNSANTTQSTEAIAKKLLEHIQQHTQNPSIAALLTLPSTESSALKNQLTTLLLQYLFSIHTKQWENIEKNRNSDTYSFDVDIPTTTLNQITNTHIEFTKKLTKNNSDRKENADEEQTTKWNINLSTTLRNDIKVYFTLEFQREPANELINRTSIFCEHADTLNKLKQYSHRLTQQHKNQGIKITLSFFDRLPKVMKEAVEINLIDLHI